MRRTFLLLAALYLMVPSVRPDDNHLRTQVEKLIEQLKDPDFRTRQAAAKAIKAIGPDALPALRKAKNHPDLDVRRYVEKCLPEIETGAFVAPRRVTLHLTKQPLSKVVEELTTQSGYKIEIPNDSTGPNQNRSFHFEKKPFWEALDCICQESGLGLDHLTDPLTVRMFSTEGTTPPHISYQGSFRLFVSALHYCKQTSVSRTIDLGARPRNAHADQPAKDEHEDTTEELTLTLNINAEPRLIVLSIDPPILTEAIDDQNRSLAPEKRLREPASGGLGRSRFLRAQRGMTKGEETVHVSLLPPARDATRLKKVCGIIPIYLQKEEKKTVVVEDMKAAEGRVYQQDGIKFEIELFRKRQQEYRLVLTMTRENQLDGNVEWDEEGRVELEDAKGNRYLAYHTSSSCDGATRSCDFSFRPGIGKAGPAEPPCKLVYVKSVPLTYNVPFEFKDLPLP